MNMIHIMQIKDGMAVLKNGVSLPISRTHLQEVKVQINNYWGDTYMTGWLILLSDFFAAAYALLFVCSLFFGCFLLKSLKRKV